MMHIRQTLRAAAAGLALFLLLLSPAQAVMYEYEDERGVTVVTDRLESIPPAYRDGARMVDAPSAPDGFSPTGEMDVPAEEKERKGLWYKEEGAVERAAGAVKERFPFLEHDAAWALPAALGILAAALVLIVVVRRRLSKRGRPERY
jgi:hypothetical protein